MRITLVAAALAALALALPAAPAQAQATRTWVSGVGDDANPCSRTAPCKTFAGAISKTAPGGEIDALDPGGFGALTITKSITLDGGGGQVASVLVAGTNGIIVAATNTDVVIIRNLRLDGLRGGGNANAGLNGIRLLSAARLTLENDDVFGFNNSCVDIEPNVSGLTANVMIRNVTMDNCGASGVQIVNGTTGTLNVNIERSMVFNSHDGVNANGGGGTSLRVQVYESNINGSVASGVTSQGTNTGVFLKNSILTGNANAAVANGGGASVAMTGSTLTASSVSDLSAPSGGTFLSWKNNEISNTGGVTINPQTPQ